MRRGCQNSFTAAATNADRVATVVRIMHFYHAIGPEVRNEEDKVDTVRVPKR